MSVRKVKAGITSITEQVFAGDATSTTGGGLAVVYNSAGLVFEYRRWGQSSWTAVTPIAGTLGTYASGGVVADGSLTGALEVCPPDAAFAAGAKGVTVRLRGVTNLVPIQLRYELDAVDYQDAVRFGLTALPNAAANAANGLHTIGSGPGQFAVDGSGAISVVVTVGTVGLVDNIGPDAIDASSFDDDWLTADGADATYVALMKSGLSTYAGGDTAGTTTLLTRIPGTVQPQTGDAFARLASYRLDQLFTADVSAPGVGSLFGDLTEDNAGTRRLTTASLVNGPTDGGGPAITVEMNTIEGE